jgi:hypothetical protein
VASQNRPRGESAASAATAVNRFPGDSVWIRVLWLFGLHTLLSNTAFLVGYYLLPEGFMRGSPQAAVGSAVAGVQDFWQLFLVTVLINLAWGLGLGTILNLNQVRGFPVGYLVPIVVGATGGLIAGTNSFAASDLAQFDAREGMALSLSVGGLEMLGYVLIIAATVRYGVYQYRSWWRWSGDWAPLKLMPIRDVRLDRAEIVCLLLGLLLILAGAYRETAMAAGLL